MKKTIIALFIALVTLPTLAQDSTLTTFDPDSIFTLTAEDIVTDTQDANQAIVGVWQYDKPSVHTQGTSIMGKLGKPIAQSKLKKKLDKAFKKLKIKKRWTSLKLTADGRWEMTVAGKSVRGNYEYNPSRGTIRFKLLGLPCTAQIKREGKHLHLLLDTDRLLTLMRLLSGLSHNETLKALAFLSENYRDVQVGFDLKLKSAL